MKKDETTQLADNLIRDYVKNLLGVQFPKAGKPDALSAWFSIKEMEDFISTAKENGGDGIKFYYGSYPENYVDQPLLAGRQTIVPVATRSKNSETGRISNKDIYIGKNGKLKILGGLIPLHCPLLIALLLQREGLEIWVSPFWIWEKKVWK